MGKNKRAKKKKVVARTEKKPKIDPVLLLGGLLLLAVLISIFRGPVDSEAPEVMEPTMARVAGEYKLVEDMPSNDEPGKVHMMVFFDFFCPHCYSFDTGLLTELESKYGSQLVVTPVGYPIFGAKAVNALRAYELAKDFGKGEEMKMAIFNAYHNQKRDISQIIVLAEIAGEVGLDPEHFKSSLEAGAKGEIIQRNIGLGNSYGLRQTPTVVLNGQYVVTNIAPENLDIIISSVLNSLTT
jgi:thiol:disulfide interchange protein DsbA